MESWKIRETNVHTYLHGYIQNSKVSFIKSILLLYIQGNIVGETSLYKTCSVSYNCYKQIYIVRKAKFYRTFSVYIISYKI